MKIRIWMRRAVITCLLSAVMIMGTAAFADEDNAPLADDTVSEESVESEPLDDDAEIDDARDEKQEMADNDETNNDAAEDEESADTDDEPYLSETDQDALLDKQAEAVIESEITQEREADAAAEVGSTDETGTRENKNSYIVRVEIYARPTMPYIPVGELSLKEGFFYWCHDGKKQNGYAVFMYPTNTDKSSIALVGKGAVCIYGRSFESVEEASQEIQGTDTKFHGYITYKPVVDVMLSLLQRPPYQEEAVYDNTEDKESPDNSADDENNEGNVDATDKTSDADSFEEDPFEDDNADNTASDDTATSDSAVDADESEGNDEAEAENNSDATADDSGNEDNGGDQ